MPDRSGNRPSRLRGGLLLFALLVSAGAALAQGPPPPPPPPPPLPPVPAPPQNPITESKRVLGKILFWEEQMSSDNTMACGTCHRPADGGTDPRTAFHPGISGTFGGPDDIAGSRGIINSDSANDYLPDGTFGLFEQVTNRRAPDFTGGAYHPRVFWDGRSGPSFTDPDTQTVVIPQGGALEAQSLGPILNVDEMSHAGRTFADVAAKLQGATPLKLASDVPPDMAAAVAVHPDYPSLFQAAFGDPAITAARIAFAIATYERTLVPNQTPWDAFNAGNLAALTPQQVQGLNLFNTTGRCNACHVPPVFSDGTFRNIGLRPIQEDPGRQNVTLNPADRGRFKVPSLRNVALRDRFFHNGLTVGLTNAVELYDNSGGPFPDNRDPVLTGLDFTPAQRDLIVLFLQGLTDPRAAAGTFPFDRPTLASERIPAGSNLYGAATPGPQGILPGNIANSPPSIDNADFKLGLGGALGGGGAILGMGTAQATGPIQLGAALLHVDPASLFLILESALPGTLPGQGFATFRIAIPDEPLLVGLDIYTQWVIFDPANGNVSATRGAAYTIF